MCAGLEGGKSNSNDIIYHLTLQLLRGGSIPHVHEQLEADSYGGMWGHVRPLKIEKSHLCFLCILSYLYK